MTWEFVACYGHHCEAFSDSCCVNAKPTPPVITGHHRPSSVGGILTTGCHRSSTITRRAPSEIVDSSRVSGNPL